MHQVATSGDYNDLINKPPSLGAVSYVKTCVAGVPVTDTITMPPNATWLQVQSVMLLDQYGTIISQGIDVVLVNNDITLTSNIDLQIKVRAIIVYG